MVYYSSHYRSRCDTAPSAGEEFFMGVVKCPVCDADVKVAGDAMVGELLTCADCGVELEVVSLSPLTVEEAPEVQEDWGE